MSRRRPVYIFLSLLALVLSGTVVVLSSFAFYLKVNPVAYLTEDQVPILDTSTRWNASDHGQVERIPRILHQTWKSETLPDKWEGVSQACRDMMPDYEYMLWTDAKSRDFIARHYPWFLDTFDHYPYNIQRADAIRYFVLYHYGGIYMDLDIGCNRPLDPLLVHKVILPKTIPVGLSNDLMFTEKHHPFLEKTIHNLIAFDYNWILNYPTVMFSTGPMFLSMVYGLYVSKHRATADADIRVLPKALYGKNINTGEAPYSFFAHYYGSSWHADDAAFIGFLGTWGKSLMWLGLFILLISLFKLPSRQRRYNYRRIGGYEILLPRWSNRTGRWHFSAPSSPPSEASSPTSDDEISPIDDIPLVNVPFRPRSPPTTDLPAWSNHDNEGHHFFADALTHLRNRLASIGDDRDESDRSPVRDRRRRSRLGVLFFFPAGFGPPRDTITIVIPPSINLHSI
ncbi:glycosyltransferase family 32 protein [Amanita muscaria]